MTLKRLGARALSLGALALAASCNTRGISYGDANSVIVVMSPELWGQVSEEAYRVLEPTIATVRDEKKFTATYQEPYGEHWNDLRRFRQMLLVGTAGDPWMQEAIGEADAPITEPGIHQVEEVWARDQTVTLILLPAGDGDQALLAYLPEVAELFDEQYRRYVRTRMYRTGVDTALADTLATEAGFTLLVPGVYRWRTLDSVYVFRNDNPDPSQLIREIHVAWRTPAPASLDAEDLIDWRARLIEERFPIPQEIVREEMTADTLERGGRSVLEVRAQWRNPPDLGWPAGGPTITRAVTCDSQDRTYLLDAWLYAPGDEKYEYMIQLETILDTFDCET